VGNFICQVISKVLASRLTPWIPKLLSEKERARAIGIGNSIMIASEMYNSLYTKRLMGAALLMHEGQDRTSA